jgi:adenosylhomocysteine nucleosidase
MQNTKDNTHTNDLPAIAIVMATHVEAKPFLDIFSLTQTAKTPCSLYAHGSLILAVSGIGKANAAIATTYCCSMFQPTWILNLGAAGATDARCPLGGIFHITRVFEPDRPHFRSGTPYLHVPDVLHGFNEATLATQDRPVIDREDRAKVSAYASLVDMEGAAVAQAARRFGIPCALFKFVSDTPDDVDTSLVIDYMRDYGKTFSRFIAEQVVPLLTPRAPAIDV